MSEIAKRLENLSPEKRELLLKKLRANQVKQNTQTIVPVSRNNPIPVSFAQARLWFLDQLEGQNASYNLPTALQLNGNLNLIALEKAIQEVINRHEILRTQFAEIDHLIVQLVKPELKLELVIINLQLETKKTEKVEQIIFEDAIKPFDIAQIPLFRVTLIKLETDTHILLFNMHHIISDGWSINILIKEIALLYQAFCKNRPSPLLPLAIQYADFSAWQRNWLQGDILEQQLNYWKQQLNDVPFFLNLPTDKPRPSLQTITGQTETFSLTPFKASLENLSRQSGTTLFMTLLTVFAILLARYSSQDHIIIGSPIANRNHTEIEPLIGFFVNTLPLRINLEQDVSFSQLLQQVKQTCLDAYAHQDLPFEKLVEELKIERNLSHHPIFQVMFDLQTATTLQLNLEDLSISPLKIKSNLAKFDLTLSIKESPTELNAELEYNSDVFDSSTIHRLITHFQALLQDIIKNSEKPIHRLEILTPAEREQILVTWNQTEVEYPQQCIHQIFETQVERNPDAVALIYENQHLSYRQLNEKANSIAHHLISLGVQPETIIGICVEHSSLMIIGLLAILKAGAAYLPLDPSYPQQRLEYLLNDAQISILLTQTDIFPQKLETTQKIDLKQWDFVNLENTTNPQTQVRPNNLAYVIYTSGSTGQPKGVMIEHQAVVNMYYAWDRAYQLSINRYHYLQMASFSFDVFTGDWVRCLCSGGRLVLCPSQWRLEPNKLYQLMQQQQINFADFVPAILRNLIDYLKQTQQTLEAMKLLIVGSDIWYRYEHQALRELCSPQTRLVHSYGVTEATIDSAYFEKTNLPLFSEGLTPIGKPYANTQLYILDRFLQPVPVGVAGELSIGGKQLARGYLNRPQLTEEKFIPNPFAEGRFYKTGDKARYLADGNIEFLGRLDNQVKLRGFRIELGEIESLLLQHSQIQNCVVLLRESATGEPQLVAYLVSDSELSLQQLRTYLQKKLPGYMIPSAFVLLERIPLSPNGKIDRKALPEVNLTTAVRTRPKTQTQELLAQIWTEILKIEPISLEDNFFELGGHSLLATQIVSRIRQNFGIELSIRSIFEYPTLEQLAQRITQQRQPDISLPPLTPIPRQDKLPLSFAQTRLWFLDQLEGPNSTYNMPFALEISGKLNIDALQKSWSDIVSRHEVLRTNFISENGYPVAIVYPQRDSIISLIDLTHLNSNELSEQLQHLVIHEAEKPFNLEQDLLGRVSLIILEPERYILLMTLHHIICDGWSINILVQEFCSLYQAYRHNQPSPLADLPIQYVDFAHWQRQILQGEYLDSQLQYWKQHLADSPTTLNLPYDALGDHSFPQSETIQLQLNLELTQQLKSLCFSNGVTLFMLLLTSFSVLLSRYSGQTDLIIGSPIANRNRTELESLIGFFVNTIPLRINLENNPSFTDLLKQVKQTCFDAYLHQDLPFEKLVEELKIERNLKQNPLFQVMFDLQNESMSQLNFEPLDVKPFSLKNQTAKFALTLQFEETEQGLLGEWEYDRELFYPDTIKQLNHHLQNLLQAILLNPTETIQKLPLLSEAEKQEILREWNPSESGFTAQCLHQLFESQVKRNPDAVAVIYQDQQLTYRQLNEKANSIAHYLISLGIQPDTCIGLFIERSTEMLIGLLGILKAGGAYLPLDPLYTTERVNAILDDAQIKTVVTLTKFKTHFNAQLDHIIDLNDWSVIENFPSENPISSVQTTNLAYLIYTSGSTGKPKGVMIEHQAVVNFIQTAIQAYQVSSEDRVLQFATLSFDAAVEEIYCTLCAGATLYLRTEHLLDSYESFIAHSEQWDLTIWDLPTAYWQQLTHYLVTNHLKLPTSLRLVIIGGEAASVNTINLWLDYVGNCPQLLNTYGPTEGTVVNTIYPITRKLDLSSVPIGYPLKTSQIYILDPQLQPVPVGVVGELYLGGSQLARGYLNQSELTQEKFIANPFSHDPFSKLYKTGDLARYLSNGLIEYIGRIDNQIKLRGLRVEIGEIETVLLQYLDLKEAIVIPQETAGNLQLIAYLVTHLEQLSPNSIRQFLQDKLPSYLIPTHFVFLDALPLTPNGKIDRKALPKLDLNVSNSNFVAPRDLLEKQLALIWSDVLGREASIRDSFFEIGGHSLLAVRLMSVIKQQLGQSLPLATLFQFPTIEQLAQILRQKSDLSLQSSVVAIQPKGSKPPLFFVHPVGGTVLCYFDLAQHLGTEQPFYGLQATHLESMNRVEAMAQQYIKEIQTIQPHGPYYLGGWSFGGLVAYEMAQQLQQQGQTIAFVGLVDSHLLGNEPIKLDNPFNLLADLFNSPLPSVELDSSLSPEAQMMVAFEQAQKMNLIPDDFDLEQAQFLWQVYQKNIKAFNAYRPQPYTGQVTLFQAEDDLTQYQQWTQLVKAGLKIYTIPSSHYEIVRPPFVADLARYLKQSVGV